MTETRLLAWHNDPGLKAEVMERLRKHRAEDEFVQGYYQSIDPWAASGYRGCAIGCTLPSLASRDVEPRWHREVEWLYGIDYRIAMAIDRLFENLPVERCADFAVDVIEAIPVGADLSGVLGDWYKLGPDDYRFDKERAAAWMIEWLRNTPVPAPVPARVLVPA